MSRHKFTYSLWLLAASVAASIMAGGCAPKSAAPIESQKHDGILGGVAVSDDDPIAGNTALLYLDDRQEICTVSVIHREWVLTAAHCTAGKDPAKMEIVFTSKPGLGGIGIDIALFRKVTEAKAHPLFANTEKAMNDLLAKAKAEGRNLTSDEVDKLGDWNDLALLHLDRPVPVTVTPAKIVPADKTFARGELVTLAGYGVSAYMGGFGAGQGLLRKVDVPVAEPVLGTSEILVDQSSKKGVCHGDSGGPGFVTVDAKQYLFGITSRSYGDKNDSCQTLSVFTNVGLFRDWVASTLGVPTAEL